MITTKGRARQRAHTLARRAGVELKAVVFNHKELVEALGYDPGSKKGGKTAAKRYYGTCWRDKKVIWFALPVSDETIAHEVMHLATSASHRTAKFRNRVVALRRGVALAKAKPRWFEVTLQITRTFKVYEFSAHAAKKRLASGDFMEEKRECHAHAL